MDSEVIKYLKKYQIRGHELIWNWNNNISSAVIIPAIKELNNIKLLLKSLTEADSSYFDNTIFVFVINNVPSSDENIKEDNLKSIELMKNILAKMPGDDLINDVLNSGLNIGYIDASTHGNELSEKNGGVGLARKTGMDEVLKIFNYSNKEPKLLICLDADCTVENNYLNEIHLAFEKKKIKAASIYFEHKI